jgi:hypothetical protein
MIGISNRSLKVRDNPTPKGCISSTSAFEFWRIHQLENASSWLSWVNSKSV